MSQTVTGRYGEGANPKRPLRTDFTGQVLRRATKARQRHAAKQQIQAILQESLSMKSINFLRTIPGATLAIATVAIGSVGVYALSNWFGGTVQVKQDASIFTVDLSACRGNLPSGVNSGDNPHAIKFKITGSPHIAPGVLQQDLLSTCEYNAVTDFYGTKFPDAGLSSTGRPTSVKNAFKYALLPATITDIQGAKVTFTSTGGKVLSFGTASLPLSPALTVYDKGQPSSLSNLKARDTVFVVAYSAAAHSPMIEGSSILDNGDVQVLSIFKTQYNDGADASFDYQKSNVMPLDMYNQLPSSQR